MQRLWKGNGQLWRTLLVPLALIGAALLLMGVPREHIADDGVDHVAAGGHRGNGAGQESRWYLT